MNLENEKFEDEPLSLEPIVLGETPTIVSKPVTLKDDEPLTLIEENEPQKSKVKAIKGAFDADEHKEFKRPLNITGKGATAPAAFSPSRFA